MRRGQYKQIPILGINTEVLDDQSPDGLCVDITNLKPKGIAENPYWVPFEKILPLKNGSDTNFSYTHGIANINGAFWQVRNIIGDFALSPTQSLKRLIVLCNKSDRKAIDIIEPTDWSIVTSQDLDVNGDYEISCTRLGEITVVNVVKDGKPYILYYLQDDIFVPNGWPDMPEVLFDTEEKTFTTPEVEAGTVEGVQKKSTNRYFMARWAFRLYDGTYVKHSTPVLNTVDTGDDTDFVLPKFTLEGYDSPIDFKEFWEGYIAGVAVFCSMPKDTEKEALDDGIFYEVGFWSFIDKKPPSEWTTVEDPNIITVKLKSSSWSTQRDLNIDNFTHHKFASKVVDTYNSRLLLGGVGIDFAKPIANAFGVNATLPNSVEDFYIENVVTANSHATNLYDENWDGPIAIGSWTSGRKIFRTNFVAYYDPPVGKSFKYVEVVDTNVVTEGTHFTDGPDTELNTVNPFHKMYVEIIENGRIFMSLNSKTAYGPDVSGDIAGTPDIFAVIRVTVGDPENSLNDIQYEFTANITYPVPPADGETGDTNMVFDNLTFPGGSGSSSPTVYHIVTIKTDNGTYQRISSQNFSISGSNSITIPQVIYYPDRRAINYKIVVSKDGVTDYEVAIDKSLIQHPESNYSYAVLTESERFYLMGSSSEITQSPPDMTVNNITSYIRNMVQASQTNQPLIFDAATTYRVGNKENDSIQAFAVNAIDISTGQYGQFPLYVLTDKSAWALEQTSDPAIAFGSITPVNNFNGTENPYAVCNTSDQNIIAADKNYIYLLIGQNAQRIDRAISQDPDYDSYLQGIRLAFHKTQDYEELICSNPNFSYSWVYNLRYKVWYKGSEVFRYFFQEQPYILGITTDDVIKDFKNKDTSTEISWSLKTRPWNFGNRYELKKWIKGIIRTRLSQANQADPNDYLPINVKVLGWMMDYQSGFAIIDYNRKEETNADLWLLTRFGAFNAFSLELSGQNKHQDGYIHVTEVNYETRYETRIRR